MAVNEDTRKKYIPTIGIETHVQLKTKTKLFSAIGNDARDAAPNTLISHIDTGMPGALPVLNEKAIELACRAAYALNSTPQKFSKFDRKHYFYPDLPKGYQITQFEDPIIKGGSVKFDVDGQEYKVEITRVHLEEDAGKNVHPAGADYTLVDLNRAGTPLLEIVSEPQIHSAAQAKAYTRELYLLMKYADVSDVDLYHGNMRFDVNVSVSTDPNKPGKRAEVKNLNSFRSVENAVEYEINRQIELYEKGGEVVQETSGWDEAKQKTTSQRGKEEAHDYRYMPEPDIPPVVLDDEYMENIKSSLPVMPNEWRKKLSSIDLGSAEIESMLEGEVEDDRISYLPLIEHYLEDKPLAKFLADWFLNVMIPLIREDKFKFGDPSYIKLEVNLYELLKKQKINSNVAKQVFIDLSEKGEIPEDIEKYIQEKGLIQVSDEGEIEKIVAEVLEQNTQAAKDVQNGEMKAIGFLVGQVMAKSQGKANPQMAQQIIKKQLGIQ